MQVTTNGHPGRAHAANYRASCRNWRQGISLGSLVYLALVAGLMFGIGHWFLASLVVAYIPARLSVLFFKRLSA